MERKSFKLWHSVAGLFALVFVETALLSEFSLLGMFFITVAAAMGAIATIYIATEVIEEVRNSRHMLVLLSLVVLEFVVFFASQYWLLCTWDTASFPTLLMDPVSLMLHSTMIFVFNPLSMPETLAARTLLLVHTLGALGLVMFILQNVWQFRRPASRK